MTADTYFPEPPFFDTDAVRHELTAMFKSAGSADAARPAVLARLKELLSDAHEGARGRIAVTNNGRDCASALCEFHDELIRLIYDYTVAHVYHVTTSASSDETIAIAATGGYGRGLLAPYSDIDLLFILPYRQTPWSESVAEYMLYLLWDLGLKVGHATRTVTQCVSLAKTDMTIRTSLLDARYILGDRDLYDQFETRSERRSSRARNASSSWRKWPSVRRGTSRRVRAVIRWSPM